VTITHPLTILSFYTRQIWELEDIYLEETPSGNIIRGWEMDGKPLFRRHQEDRDSLRLFSYSSYDTFMEKSDLENMRGQPASYGASMTRGDSATFGSSVMGGGEVGQLPRKRKTGFDDYDEDHPY